MLPSRAELQYVLFDWDGTLSDNQKIIATAMEQVLAEFGRPQWEVSAKKRNPQLSLRDNFINYFGNDYQKAYERYVEIYRLKYSSLLKGFEKAGDVLQLFAEEECKIIIMTNKDRRLLDWELPMLYNPQIFDRIICGHEAPKDKPFAEHIFYSLRGWLAPAEITPKKVWLIGDSNQDSDCAIRAGALPIRINHPIFGDDNYKSEQVYYFDNFRELEKELKGNCNVG